MNSAEPLWEVCVPLRKFLTISECPPRWKAFDLYLFRDETAAFYAGQSHCAFWRVWEHIRGGPKGHSIVGRFILVNWPKSGSIRLHLLDSRAPRFAPLGNNLDEAERSLIEQFNPCFNVSLNSQPAALPPGYLPPNAPIRYLKNYRRMLREAGYGRREESEEIGWE